MYTGIVDHCGEVLSIDEIGGGKKLIVQTLFESLELGESIALNGVCVTVTQFDEKSFSIDISPETLALTNLASLAVGDNVNLERSLCLQDRLGGHIVYGHVDEVATIVEQNPKGDYYEFIFQGIRQSHLLLKKGCVAVNGISLTVNEVNKDNFKCMLIPHTLERTNLKNSSVVNIEYDWMVKVMINNIQQREQLIKAEGV